MRGFACIGLVNPKTPENIGGVLRMAHCFKVAQVNLQGAKSSALAHCTNTPMAHRHTPVFLVDDVLRYIPSGAAVVAIELVDGATPLPEFQHPAQAVYVFGPENGSLSGDQVAAADHVVSIPTRNCLNLASTVGIVLYDRQAKSWAAA